MTGATTHHLVGYVDSVDATTGQVRVATQLGGTPGPWEPIGTYGYPIGAHPGMPVVALAPPIPPVATSTNTLAGGFTGWYSPGYCFVSDVEFLIERLPEPAPRSEWCCGGTCLRVNCDYHRDQ